MTKSIENAVSFMEKIAKDDKHGYDQVHRNGPNYDCSSLVATALNQAGFHVSKTSTTRNLYKQLIDEGFQIVDDGRKRGDIYLKVGHHVVMCTDSKNIVHASLNEKGTTKGGKSGDQTGKEICVRSFYTYKGGWDYHLRYTEKSAKKSSPTYKGSPTYKVGKTYTLQVELKVRTGAGVQYSVKKNSQLSADGRKHDKDKDGALDKGTRVTCQQIKNVGQDIWIKCPSGWVAAYYQGKVYIK